MFINLFRWILTLCLAFAAGKLMNKINMPAILGWLIVGMMFGPHAANLMPQELTNTSQYKIVLMWMQCAFGVLLGSELIWSKLKTSGKALITTTLFQSLGTFFVVSATFAVVFYLSDIPIYLAFIFGGIALATAPAPALSIVNEFHAEGPVTDTLLPMTVLDDVVGIAVFFTMDSLIAQKLSGGALPLYMIPVMIVLPILIGALSGFPTGRLLRKCTSPRDYLLALLFGVTLTAAVGWLINTYLLSSITLNYLLMGVSFSAVFSNMVSSDALDQINRAFAPVLGVSLLAAIVDLGAPLDYHLIFGAGLYTFIYIASRAFGKYFGARLGATLTRMPETVSKYLGLTLLPHSGVSLVFTSIICTTLSSRPESVHIIQGTIAAAAIINEFIAVVVAKKGFERAGEIKSSDI
ncbi:MAG: cation:proton antiporter [Firmicutes bacterium]|nr:cation:proton antiporter [Bacillota bacterium]